MNPSDKYNKQTNYARTSSVGTDGILPPPQQAAARRAQTAFPPLGATLSSYAPDGSAQPDSIPKPRRNWKQGLKRIFIVLLIIGLLGGSFLGFKVLSNAGKSLRGNLLGLLQNDKLKGEDQGRVNILLAGNSADDAGHAGGDLTDSIMIVSLDTKNHTGFLLSIPRDLWVKVPNEGYNKINSAYVYGKADKFSESGYPSGGMGLLEKILSDKLGISINYYALVNYSALRDAVNAVGGIDVTIASIDPRGLYDPSRDYSKSYRAPLVNLTNGTHHLDGQAALNLARARGDAYGSYGFNADYTRTADQRLMLTALKDKASTAGVAANPVKVASLLDSFGNNVTSDFQTSEVRRLAELSKSIPSASIKSASLNDANSKNLLASYRSPNGQSALTPALGIENYTAIDAYIQTLLNPPTATTPAPASSPTTSH